MGRTIQQDACPECGHEQHDMVMHDSDLYDYDWLESLCTECGETFYKPIVDGASQETEGEHNG